jgi:hypothetical protein
VRAATTMAVTPALRPARTHWRPAGLAWALWALAMLGFATIPWFDHFLRAAGRPELAQLDASGVPAVVGIVSASTGGAVLASRRPRHPVGWLLLGLGLSASPGGCLNATCRGWPQRTRRDCPAPRPSPTGWCNQASPRS